MDGHVTWIFMEYVQRSESSMSLFERLLAPGSTELPECRCGHSMHLARTEELGDQTDAQIRVYNCTYCRHEMRLTVWTDT